MLACGAAPLGLHAQEPWPGKPVRLIVPTAAGSAPDVVARLLADKLGQALGPDADRRQPAGRGRHSRHVGPRPLGGRRLHHRLRAGGHGHDHAARLQEPAVQPRHRIAAVATVGTSPLIFATYPTSGIHNVADLVRLAKAQPGKLNFAAPQPNSLPHLAGELLAKQAGISSSPCPTRGRRLR